MGVHLGYGAMEPHAILGDLLKRQNHGKADLALSTNFALAACSLADAPLSAGRLSTCSKALRHAMVKAMQELQRERLYVVGGLDSSFAALATVERYDPLEGSWETLLPLPTARHGTCLAAFASHLYVIGGEVSGVALRDVQRFCPRGAQTWEMMPALAVGRIKAAAAECQGCLYVMGGNDGFGSVSSVECFDPLAGCWKDVAPMQKPRYASCAAARDDCIIVFGGELTEAGAAASVEVYDAQVNTWHLLPTLRSPLCGSVAVLTEAGDQVYCFGGLGLSGQALTFAERAVLGYEDQQGTACKPSWSPLPPMLTARQQMSACTFEDGLVIVGGKGITSEAQAKVEYYSQSSGWQALPPLPSARLRSAVIAGNL
ncbi:unnamed protein product [Effrenium voratum]|uniref:Uncharacterized protein n=1 Tax=Effrenium voratum TaxID=2562239 RepID=A0AA36JKK0_9DINO|nr:unnamed protein product [Effrenium voratum]CAJ1407920.1 unnamed protein product [Effrenium voratum]CAJ1438849.1 unnamed protein product [Effrenium voratum]